MICSCSVPRQYPSKLLDKALFRNWPTTVTNQLVASCCLGFYVVFYCFCFVCCFFFADHTGWLSSLWGIAKCIGKYRIINTNRRGWAQMAAHWSVCRGFNFLAKPRATILKITSKIMLAVILTVPGVQIIKKDPKWRVEDKKRKIGRGRKEGVLSPSLPTPFPPPPRWLFLLTFPFPVSCICTIPLPLI